MALPLLSELKRRRVIRALIGYAVAAFAVLQIVEPIMHGLHWPDAVLSWVVVALAAGFPLVVGLAWIFDVTAGGIQRTPSWGALRGPRLVLVLVAIGALSAAPGLLYYFVVRHRPAEARAAGDASIAVLPFVNLSSDKEQEYFSDGIAEEILNALAQVNGLRVIGRTSSFSMKGKNEDLRAIGQQLNVANLLEGSVRKAGARVRITAQLIETAGGSHLWSQQFDRELTDVFAVQAEIAQAVVAALKLKLLPTPREEQRAVNPEAYDQFLLGRAFNARGSRDAYVGAVQALRKSVALEPGYAPAWAALAQALYWAADQDAGAFTPDVDWPKAEAAAEKAIALAPDLVDGYTARALLRVAILKDREGARVDLERARSLDPGGVEILLDYAWLLATLGSLQEAIVTLRNATVLDPLSAEGWTRLSGFYLGSGQLDLAEAAANRALQISPEQGRAARNLGFAFLLAKRIPEAQAAFHRSSDEFFTQMGETMVEHTLGHLASSQRVLDQILAQPFVLQASYQIAQVYAWRGEADRTFEWLARAVEHHDPGLNYLKYDPIIRTVRGDARFAALLRKLNLPPD